MSKLKRNRLIIILTLTVALMSAFTVGASKLQVKAEPPKTPVTSKIIIDCNSISSSLFTGNTIDRNDYRYGLGAVRTSGAGYQLTAQNLNVGQTDLTKDTLVLALWLYIEADLITSNVNGQIEISSNSQFDKNELFWDITDLDLENGWNWVVLKGEDGYISGGYPDFDNLTRFRLYVNNIAYSVCKIDRITLTNTGDIAGMQMPDWESETSAEGAFSGANGSEAKNEPFMDVDLTPDEITELITHAPDNTLAIVLISFGGVAALGLSAFALLFYFKKFKAKAPK